MIALQCQRISKSFGLQEVLKDITLSINERERIGIIGGNGSGKTTLLRCLTGQEQVDTGEVMKSASLSLGYLEQMPDLDSGLTAWDAVMASFASIVEQRQVLRQMETEMADLEGDELSRLMDRYARVTESYERANGYACENTARRILIGMGFPEEDFQKPLTYFSGGQKTRIHLARLLALSPDILLLDEPTNHLDMPSVEWLENFLQSYSGTVLVVSHDRMFLDRTATRVAEMRAGRLRTFEGNYSSYIKKRAAEDQMQQRAFDKQQEQIHETEEYIRRYGAGIKARQARGRLLQLNRLERLEAPDEAVSLGSIQISLERESAQDVLTVENLAKAYGPNMVIHNMDVQIKKGDKLALIGPNGCGKTTLLKLITGKLKPDEGKIKLGSRVDLAYFSQEHEDLHPELSVLEEILYDYDLTLEQARSCLGAMLFCGDDVFKSVGSLSGGEQGRLVLLKLILSGANFLILDEPTNHLDIDSRQVVQDMLAAYKGTVLLVSHDRYFIDGIVDQVLAMEDGKLQRYWGNYSYYAEKVQEKNREAERLQKEKKEASLRPDQKMRSEQKARLRNQRQLTRQIEELEERISQMEERKAELESMLSDPNTYTDEEASKSCQEEYNEIQNQLAKSEDEWTSLSEELMELEESMA